ncbi:hypothetical protein FRC04_006189 [Tulasnella sp. 424]|nr:hypothetical protein FRC04_006189 [Tulasnella sp. 424]KAG8972970.1 hypothetical protein FRC05_009386 [Tulasnella sp. 425]
MADVLKKFLAPRNVKKNGPVLVLFIISLCILAYHQYSASSFARLEISSPHLPEWRVSEAVKSRLSNVAFGESPGSRALRDARRHHSYHRAKRPIRLGQDGDGAEQKTTAADIPVVEGAA